MENAVQKRLELDIHMNRARQNAAMLVHELREFIPDHSRQEAIHRLGRLFYEEQVEITTAQSRRLSVVR